MQSKKTQLEEFLFSPLNSHAKESIINNKLLFDLKLAAAERGYFLNAYTPEVDQDGFDYIFDDKDLLSKIQLKTVMKRANTKNWQIHKSLLRPDMYIAEDLGFTCTQSHTGYQGGVILIEIEDNNGLNVAYYYTDIIILCGLRDKIINKKRPPSEKVLNNFFGNLVQGTSHEKITLNKSMFLKANSPASLLALMGFHNSVNTSSWQYHIQKIAYSPYKQPDLAAPEKHLKKYINEEIASISTSVKPLN
ncbi:hypothetical protein [Pseudoalteromonas sp. MMG024]|uniref:hypothetical protein n=1 Tax=Pseudoalteromonas sp. MMG024 TaxID=2909980 RepID=UPI001F235557|nr:hypothetical protein [Pseudoalteromonas sp. MMG024]MCF6459157.1 hypothetical protein [Pseudoalteromonas sp. MMG024]